jgi:hypothetical protein
VPIQSSAYQLVLDHRLGSYEIPEGYCQLAAGNRLEDRASTFELASPLKNRFGHCMLKIPSVEDWTKWAITHDVDVRVIGFLNYRRDNLFTFDPKMKENSFATPRSWSFTSDQIKEIDNKELDWLQLVAATNLGIGIAGEFAQFIRIKDRLKTMDYYLKDPENCDLPKEGTEMDLLWALVTSFAEYYKGHTDAKTLASMIKLLGRLNEEFTIFTLELMIAVDRALPSKLGWITEAQNWQHVDRLFGVDKS